MKIFCCTVDSTFVYRREVVKGELAIVTAIFVIEGGSVITLAKPLSPYCLRVRLFIYDLLFCCLGLLRGTFI